MCRRFQGWRSGGLTLTFYFLSSHKDEFSVSAEDGRRWSFSVQSVKMRNGSGFYETLSHLMLKRRNDEGQMQPRNNCATGKEWTVKVFFFFFFCYFQHLTDVLL